jgi:fatty-acyl-CoA synthase
VYHVDLRESYFPAQADDAIRPTTVAGVLREAAADSADVTALTEVREDGTIGRSWTYGSLLTDSERLADALLSRFAAGERVAIWSPNTPEWAIFEFAAAIAGLTLVTVNPAFQAKELRYVLEQSRAAGLYTARSFRGNPMATIAREVCSELPAIRHLVDIDEETAFYAVAGAPKPRPVVGPRDPAQIQYTSGTTGFPKGAVLTHVGLTNNARLCFARLGARRGDVYLNVMPMFHTSGCATGLLGSVQWRCPLVMAKLFQPAVTNAIIAQQRVNLLIAVPTMLIGLLEQQKRTPCDMGSVRVVMSGGAMVPPELVRSVQDAFGCNFAIIYGQTESSPGLTLTRPTDAFADQVESVGQAFPQTEVSIRDRATNAVVPVGTAGEICGRGYCTMLEYNDNPAATADAIDAEGWLHTGDLGTMDSRGYVRVTGRVKDMIIRGGENLFPAEIENVIASHPSVAEVAVVGVPDPKWGEIAICFFRAATPVLPSKADLVAHLRRDLAAPKTPAQFVAVESFPLTGSGKIQKFVLRDRYVAGDFSGRAL